MPRVRPRLPARLIGVALGASAVVAVLAGQAAQASVPATFGYRDFGYGGAQATRVTSDPEQSKLWYTGGSWWGGLFHSSGVGSGGSYFAIYRFDPATHGWVPTAARIDTRDHSHADYFWDEAGQKLYVASSKSICDKKFDGAQPCNDSIRVYRFTFAAGSYTLDVGFPKILAGGGYAGGNFTGGGSNAITIAKDSAGEVWVAFTRDDPTTAAPPITGFQSNVYVLRSPDGGVTWPGSLTRLPGSANGDPGEENTAAIVAFNGKVGVYWTDVHATGSSTAKFAFHTDGDATNTWSAPETVAATAATNQVNLKADSAGKVYAVAKTSASDQIKLFDRTTGGAWTAHAVSTAGNGNTRAQVVIDEELNLAYVLSSTGGIIYIKAAPLGSLTFPSGKGSPFIQSTLDPSIDDVTTTKQIVEDATGILAEASDRVSFEFLHGEMTLAAADGTPPDGSVTINAGAAFTATDHVTLSVPATDAGSGVSLVRVANDSNSTSGGVLDNASATSFTWSPTVAWTLSAGDGTKTVWVQFRDSAGFWSAPVSDTIGLDTTGPAGSVSINGNADTTGNPAVTLTVPATDAGVGVVANIRIANVGATSGGVLSDPSAVTRPYAASQPWNLAVGPDGSRTVYVQWQDSLGNWSGVANDSINLQDVTPPVGAVAINGVNDTGVHSLSVTLQFPGLSPDVDYVTVSNSPTMSSPIVFGNDVAKAPFSGTVPWTLPGPLTNYALKHVYVTFHDIAGNESVHVAGSAYTATDVAKVDLTRPVTKGPVRTSWPSGVTMTTAYLPLRLTWPAGTDTITGVGSYQVYLSRDGGAYAFAGSSATLSKIVSAAANHVYRAKIYAVDRAGNRSTTPAYSASVRVLAYQNTNPAVKFTTGWGTATDASFYGGSTRYSNTRAKTASLTFSGKSVAWLSALGPTRGSARVYVDNVLIATVNLNSATTTTKRVVFARNYASVGTHTIRVTVLGTAGHPRVDVDAFLVLR